ncbi:MAG: acyl-CoA dehydrogenase [Thermoleophilaceae bacterium]|jgi:acyl-CoA dehydrogenase|nr:acyl-CoA dehydrogenase [Thermoleophilaceae bacterium]
MSALTERPDRTGTRPLPPFTEEHDAFRAEVREFVQAEFRPHATEWEAAGWFPNEAFSKLAERGWLGIKFPKEYGGLGGDYVMDAAFTEELAHCGSGGLAAGLGAHMSIAMPPVWKFGTDEQKQRWLVPGIRAEKIGALGITEPGAGSDVAGIRTVAKKVDGGYVLNGAKTFITNGCRADFVVTAVKTTSEGGHGGLSFVVVEKGMDGFDQSKKLDKLGWRASDTGELAFQDVFVPDENLLGEENKGFYLIMANFQWERLLMAHGAIGSMRLMLESAVELAKTVTHGRSAARHRVAEMALKLNAGEAITYHALRKFGSGQDAIREVTMAKLVSQRGALEVAESTMHLLSGGAGAWDEQRLLEVDRAVRDLRLGPIGGGTDEIMKEILGKQMGL